MLSDNKFLNLVNVSDNSIILNFDVFSKKPKLVIDRNTEGSFGIGERNGLQGILKLLLHISNIGKQPTTINYFQLFILDNKKREITYGFRHKDINIKISPNGPPFKIDLGKIIILYKNSPAERKDNSFKLMLSSVVEADLTLEKLFAKVLVVTPHKTWAFEVPLIEIRYSEDFFLEDLKKSEELDKNFNSAFGWDLK